MVGVVFSQNASLEERMFFDLESNSAISLDKLAGRLLVTNKSFPMLTQALNIKSLAAHSQLFLEASRGKNTLKMRKWAS